MQNTYRSLLFILLTLLLNCCKREVNITLPSVLNIDKFTSFNDSDLTPQWNAEIVDGLLYLTRARANQAGAAYKNTKVTISSGFEASFSFSMTEPGGIKDGKNRVGADGITFVIQDYGSKIIPPAGGLGLGYDGLPRSLAIEFDTFDDLYYGIPKESPDDIWLNTQGVNANSADDNRTLIRPSTRPLPVMNDGKIHNVVVRYTRKSAEVYTLTVFMDGNASPYLTADNINIERTIGSNGTGVYMGLTASTGAGWENHIIHKWSIRVL